MSRIEAIPAADWPLPQETDMDRVAVAAGMEMSEQILLELLSSDD